MSLSIDLVPVSDFQQNCRILYDSSNGRAVIFDPGGDAVKVVRRVNDLSLTPEGIYLTHSHLDHCGAVAPLLKAFPVPLYAHAAEQMMRQNISKVAQMYGLSASAYFDCPEPQIYLEEGMEIDILGVKTRILSTPGHSPGSISFFMPSEGLLLSGDVLFFDSIGRTDLPGGDQYTLIATIGRLMRLLDSDTRVLSGHGPDTTIGRERENNPFLK